MDDVFFNNLMQSLAEHRDYYMVAADKNDAADAASRCEHLILATVLVELINIFNEAKDATPKEQRR